jgi:hypothetical protein
MLTDVTGRVRNIQLPLSKPLLPLFEAINNSIQAIEDAKVSEGKIRIEIIRTDKTVFSAAKVKSEQQADNIDEFIIRDNGIGFDDRNFLAFQTSDTTSKVGRGGKGIGRFMWLAAYDSVDIDSVFYDNGQAKRRKFTFCKSVSGIEDLLLEDVKSTQRETIVHLKHFQEKYQKQCPKRIETIAAYIVEEFLDIFMGSSCPLIVLHDNATGQDINLDSFYEKEMVAHADRKNIEIKGSQFQIVNIRLYSNHISDHNLYLCAHDRVVTRDKITSIPNMARRLQDAEGKDFVYAVYVNSHVLDTAVNSDRTGFNLEIDETELYGDHITIHDIKSGTLAHSKNYLSAYTEPIAKEKRDRIRKYVESDGAMYRPIMKHLEHTYDNIKPDATNDEIDLQLYEAYHELQIKVRKEGGELLQTATLDDMEYENFRERFDVYFETVSELNRADLARYVCHRKAIISFLKQQLSRQDDGKYHLEDRVHSIIFPRGKTSDEILFEEHSLWLIDERLAFHVFLSSDQAIRKAKPLDNNSKKEPDILIQGVNRQNNFGPKKPGEEIFKWSSEARRSTRINVMG